MRDCPVTVFPECKPSIYEILSSTSCLPALRDHVTCPWRGTRRQDLICTDVVGQRLPCPRGSPERFRGSLYVLEEGAAAQGSLRLLGGWRRGRGDLVFRPCTDITSHQRFINGVRLHDLCYILPKPEGALRVFHFKLVSWWRISSVLN